MNDYDYILIDCPPGISLFAEAALIAADTILVPSIPDYVSRLGLITFRKRALRLINERRGGPGQLMVLATKYEDGFSLHRSEASLLKDNLGDAMFDVRIPQNVDIAKAAEWSETPRTFEQKYGSMANTIKKARRRIPGQGRGGAHSMSLNKTLDRLFDEIRREAKRSPDFADRLDAVLQRHDSRRDVSDEVLDGVALADPGRLKSSPQAGEVASVEKSRRESPPTVAPRPLSRLRRQLPQAGEQNAPQINPAALYRKDGEEGLGAALADQDLAPSAPSSPNTISIQAASRHLSRATNSPPT